MRDANSTLVCIECKPRRGLADPVLYERLRRVRHHLRSVDIAFLVVTEDDLSDPVLNDNCLRMVRALRDRWATSEMTAAAEVLQTTEPANLGQLRELLGLRRALAAISHGLRYVDMRMALGDRTALMLAPPEHCDAADFLFPIEPSVAFQAALPDRVSERLQADHPAR